MSEAQTFSDNNLSSTVLHTISQSKTKYCLRKRIMSELQTLFFFPDIILFLRQYSFSRTIFFFSDNILFPGQYSFVQTIFFFSDIYLFLRHLSFSFFFSLILFFSFCFSHFFFVSTE